MRRPARLIQELTQAAGLLIGVGAGLAGSLYKGLRSVVGSRAPLHVEPHSARWPPRWILARGPCIIPQQSKGECLVGARKNHCRRANFADRESVEYSIAGRRPDS
jgi:hypothetical protein